VYRKVAYCLVPRDLALDLHEYLREVSRPGSLRKERRAIRGLAGRRVGARRVMTVAFAPPPLPPKAQPHAERLTFVERLEPSRRAGEDRETNRLVVRIQSGDSAAFDQLYLRYFDRVYAYARVALHDPHEAEDVAQQVFANIIQALPRYEVREDAPFRGWLFRVARNAVLRAASRNGRLRPEEPAALDRRLEIPIDVPALGLDWLSDTDLAMLVERLPLSQRQVILLRYAFELTTDEIAGALERSPVAVRMLEHRAMRALEARLAALRGRSVRCDRSPMVARARELLVIANRRLALHSPGGVPSA
jgi:RNA polymerase sigma-70 factor (ECF subfamily)